MDDRAWLAGAIELNCEALLRIAMRLVVMLRPPVGCMTDSVPASLYYRVLRLLRSAESAVRRLIVLEAIGLDPEPERPRKDVPGYTSRSGSKAGRDRKPVAQPAFQLFDPFKPLPDNPWMTDGDMEKEEPLAFPGLHDFRPDEPRDATSLRRRAQALLDALVELPAQARRLARWRLKRLRPRRLTSLRPGFPPGYRRGRPVDEVDEILRECMSLLAWAEMPPGRR